MIYLALAFIPVVVLSGLYVISSYAQAQQRRLRLLRRSFDLSSDGGDSGKGGEIAPSPVPPKEKKT